MVIPMMMAPPAETQEMLEAFQIVKYPVLGLWVLVPLRFMCSPGLPLSILMSAIIGTFLLKDVDMFVGCYESCFKDGFIETVLAAGGNLSGVRCAFMALFVWFLNAFFDFIDFYSYIHTFGELVPCTEDLICYNGFVTLLGIIFQAAGVIVLWNVVKKQLFGGEREGGHGGYDMAGAASPSNRQQSGSYIQNGYIQRPPAGQSAGGLFGGGGFGGAGAPLGSATSNPFAGGRANTAEPLAPQNQRGFVPFGGSGQVLGDK